MTSNISLKFHVTFRNTDSSEPLKAYATDKIGNCVQKFVHQDTEVSIVLKVEKSRQIAEVSLHSDGSDFHVSEESESMYASIDKVVDSLSTQLRKHKEKITSHHYSDRN